MTSKNKSIFNIGILSAIPEELGLIVDNLQIIEKVKYGDLEIFKGIYEYDDQKIFVSAACSGWGKVCAARAATRIISEKINSEKIDFILFTGVAGAIKKDIKQGDVILSEELIQHDFDASPIYKKYVIPALKKSKLNPKKEIVHKFFNSFIREKNLGNLKKFGEIKKGLIATGDKFISDCDKETLSEKFPYLLAVEMEGAAFAQVASQEQIDWLVIRVVSDSADKSADLDFNNFLEKYRLYSWELISCFLRNY